MLACVLCAVTWEAPQESAGIITSPYSAPVVTTFRHALSSVVDLPVDAFGNLGWHNGKIISVLAV